MLARSRCQTKEVESKFFTSNYLKFRERETEICNAVIEEVEDIEHYQWNEDQQLHFGEQLTTDQKEMIEEVLKLFPKATKRTPEKTHKISHKIQTTNCLLIQQKPYRIPQAYRDEVLKELEEMEKTANRCLGCWCWGCVKSRREWRSTNRLL